MEKVRPLTYRQIRAIEFWVNSGRKSKAQAIRQAQYTEAIARQPHKVFNSPAVRAELERRGLGSRGTDSSLTTRVKRAPTASYVAPEASFDVSQIPPEQIQWLKEQLKALP